MTAATLAPARSERWECDPDVLCCQYGHPILHRKTGVVQRTRRVASVAFYICTTCGAGAQGKTYFLADAYASEHGAIAFCFAIRGADFDYWTGPALYAALDGGTLELLWHLGYAASWRGVPTPHLPTPQPPRVPR